MAYLFTQSLHLNAESFLIYYGSEATHEMLSQYETVVLEPDNYVDVTSMSSTTYAYISVGEISPFRNYFELFNKKGYLLERNQIWGGHLVKFNDYWQGYLLDIIIPDILLSGYKGIMLDTVDMILYHGIAPQEDVVKFIRTIKQRYPDLKIMLNRAFEIANDAPIDSLLLESTITTHDFDTKEYTLHPKPLKFGICETIKCYSVDYWPQNDIKTVEKIIDAAHAEGYTPLVTDISLQLIPEISDKIKQQIIKRENKHATTNP